MAELYNLPDGWEWKKLNEVCKFIRGPFGGSLKKQIFKDSGNAVYEQSHAIYNQFEQIRYFIDDEKFEEMKRFELVPNSLIMSCSGTIGKVAIVPNNVKKGIINQALLMLITNEKLNNIFLKLLIESNFFQNLLSENSTGAAISNVASVKVLKEIQIPLPPIEEQKRIVAKLDNLFAKIDKAIALHQKNIDEANVFMASVLNDVFVELEEKYEKKYLDEISFLIDGDRGSNYPKKEEFFENEFCLFLNAKNVTKNGFLFLEKQFITKEKDNILRKGKLDREDLIITTRGTIGNVSIYDKSIEFDNVRINSGMAIIRLKEKDLIYNRYIYKYLFAPQFLNYLSDVQSGSAQPQITIKNLKESIIPIPPLKTQQKVVSYLDEISQKMEKIKQIQKEKMQSLKALKASILDQAFKGEL